MGHVAPARPPAALLRPSLPPSLQLMVHSGFLAAYDSVKQQVFSLIDAATGSGDKGTWRVLVTGHSLGGALATLAAYELACRQ